MVQQQARNFLENLLATISPSGYEYEAAEVIKQYAATFAQRVTVDVHGNVVAVINPGGRPRIMLAGHMDEIGLQITNIDDNGYLRFATIGGWDPQIMPGQRVWIRSAAGRVTGVIGKKPIHLMKEEDRKKVVRVEQMWIDIGAASAAEASKRVSVGDCAVLAQGFEQLSSDIIAARGIDNRCGAFVVFEAAKLAAELNPRAEVYAVATVQEEIGLRGAITSAYHIQPQVAIAVDVAHATDYPSVNDERERVGHIRLGGGPVVSRGPNINPRLFTLLQEVASDKQIPTQILAEPRGTGTDANVIQLARGGVATGLISIPNRYMHTPVELIHLKDLEWAYTLIAHTISRITDETNFVPW